MKQHVVRFCVVLGVCGAAGFGGTGCAAASSEAESSETSNAVVATVAERVTKIIVDKLHVDETEVTKDANFIQDLGSDCTST